MTRKHIYAILQDFLLKTYHYDRLPKHLNFIIKDILKKTSHVIVSDYYRSWYEGGFFDFICDSLATQTNPFVSWTIITILDTFIEMINYYEGKLGYKVIQIIGDLHDIKHTKLLCIKNNQKILVYNGEYNSESTITSILTKHDSSLQHYFPTFHVQWSIVEREFIEYELNTTNKNHIKQYYSNLGYILSYFVFLRGVDMHYDNVCCNIPYPCFFDIETLFSQTLTYEDMYQWSFSINFTSILYDDTVGEWNHSVLFGPLFKWVTLYYPFIVFRNSKPAIKRKKYFNKENHSLPLLDNKPVNLFDYSDDIITWYEKGCKKLFAIGPSIIQDFQQSKHIYKRTLLHKTSFYEGLQRYLGYKSHEPSSHQEINSSRMHPHISYARQTRKQYDTSYMNYSADLCLFSTVT